MNGKRFWAEQHIVQTLNNIINISLNNWKEQEPFRIDNIENQPKLKYNKHVDIDPYGEENWED